MEIFLTWWASKNLVGPGIQDPLHATGCSGILGDSRPPSIWDLECLL